LSILKNEHAQLLVFCILLIPIIFSEQPIYLNGPPEDRDPQVEKH